MLPIAIAPVWRRQRFDLLNRLGFGEIVDIGLPDRSGDDLVREIRSMHSSLPIIVATGKGAQDVSDIFQGMKYITFLGKPYLAEDLYKALRALHVAIQE